MADAAYRCDGCGRLSVVTWMTANDPAATAWERDGRHRGPQPHEVAKWSPPPGHQVEFLDVPQAIASAATEAWTCRTVGGTRGAVALSSRCWSDRQG